MGKKGRLARLVIADGKSEWIVDENGGRARQESLEAFAAVAAQPEQEMRRIQASYDLRISPGRRVAGRPTWLVELSRRADRKLSRRFWLDRQYGLILKDELFGLDGKPSSSMGFSKVVFSQSFAPGLFSYTPSSAIAASEPPRTAGTQVPSGAGPQSLPALKMPAWLPPGYSFDGSRPNGSLGSPALQLRFSDGLAALSLFECREGTRFDFEGLKSRGVSLASGQKALLSSSGADDLILQWSGGGETFMLVGPLEPEVLERIAESLPR